MKLEWYQYFELFSLLWAFYCRRGLNAFFISVMIPILLLDNITEIIAVNHEGSNYFIYNIYLLLSTPLNIYLFSTMLDANDKEKRRLLWAGLSIEAFILTNYLFIQGRTDFNTFSVLLIEIVNIVLSCLVLTRLAIRKDDESPLLRDPYFWINAMILLFSMVTLIILGLQKYIAIHHVAIRNKVLYFAIMPAANAVLYTGYSWAFFLCRMQASK